MPISRDPRMDRRRRVLRENSSEELTPGTSARGRLNRAEELPDSGARRSAGYSQDVRGACGHRLVQLIPVRRRSYLTAITLSVLIPCLLLLGHYMIYVSGTLAWYGQPLATALDAFHPQSLAAWFCSHLWLLCLGTTLLTFQLRKHKLDDYNGEYRLWFWLVLTCLIGSIDSTTHLTELLGMSLHPWTTLQLGWSGPAVVKATLGVLIGMLGLRLCTELKSVPTSLIFWLIGLTSWAASAALGQDLLKLDMSQQIRIWLRCALWLGGLTCIWLASLSYLRSIYIEAQRRFLLRGRLATSLGVPLHQRLRDSLPKWPGQRRPGSSSTQQESDEEDEEPEVDQAGNPARSSGWAQFGIGRRKQSTSLDESSSPSAASPQSLSQPAAAKSASSPVSRSAGPDAASQERGSPSDASSTTRGQSSSGLSGFFKPKSNQASADAASAAPASAAKSSSDAAKPSRLWGWLPKAKDANQTDEYSKLRTGPGGTTQTPEESKRQSAAKPSGQSKPGGSQDADAQAEAPRSGWMPRLSSLKLPRLRLSPRAWIPKIKLPSLGLSSLRLKPPKSEGENAGSGPEVKRSTQPSNTRATPQSTDPDDDVGGEDEGGHPMSKAERKRLRRMQQQNRAA